MIKNLQELIPAFFVGPNGQPLSQDEIARRREVASSLLGQATDTSPNAGGMASVVAKAIQGLSYGINEGRAARGAAANAQQSQDNITAMLGGAGGTPSAAGAFPPAPTSGAQMMGAPAPDIASARVAQAHGDSAAPANLSESKQAFVSALLPTAIEVSQQTGIDPRIIVAQAAQETGWGRSAPGNNYFGIKSHGQGGGQTFATHEYVNGKRVNIRDSFRQFGSPADSVRGYGEFIQKNPRYKSLMEAQGLDAQLEALQASGYATDPNYSRSVGAIARGIPMPDAVAANEAMAQGALTPEVLQSYAEQRYAPGAVSRQPLTVANPMVAETPEDILAAEAAMNDPAFAPYEGVGANGLPPSAAPGTIARGADGKSYQYAETTGMAGDTGGSGWVEVSGGVTPSQGTQARPQAPMAAAPQPIQPPMPMPSPAAAQALTAMPVNEVLPMAGGANNPRPTMPTVSSSPMAGINPAVLQSLSNPNATPQERAVANSLLQQQMAQNQAMQAQAREQAERATMLAQRRGLAGQMGINPSFADDDTIWKEAASANFRDPASYTPGSYVLGKNGMEQLPEARTTDIQQYEYAKGQGYEGSFADFQQAMKRAGATSVNVGQSEFGTIPPGWEVFTDPATGGRSMRPIEGGPAAREAAAEAEAAANRSRVQTRSEADQAQTTLATTDKVLDILNDKEGGPATGTLSRPFAMYSGTNAGRVRSYVGTLQSGVALGAMTRLKEASATGATGFGALSEKELDILINDIGALNPDTTEPDIFKDTIQRIRDRSQRVANDIAKNVSPERIQELGLQTFIDSFASNGDVPEGIDPDDWKYLTPEERRAFQ